MKTLRLIYMVAAVALLAASCGEWDSDLEKARITNFGNYGEVRVYVTDGSYHLSWDQPEINTNKRYLAVGSEGALRYDIYVTTGYGVESMNFVKKVNAQSADLTFAEVAEALGTLPDDTYGFMFCVRMSDFNNVDFAYGYSDILKQQFTVSAYTDYGRVTGTGNYNYGEKVVLKAVPDEGYVFVCWSDGSTENPRRFTITEDINLEAFFEDDFDGRLYKVTAIADEGNGYVEGGGLYAYADFATLTAVPNSGYVFSCWSDGIISNPRQVLVDEDIELVAYFESRNLIDKGYQGINTWFVDRNATGYVEDDNFIINILGEVERNEDGDATVWNDNLEIVFHGLENQIVGNEFLMEFDIVWNGAGDKETAGFRICSGVDNYISQIAENDNTYVPLTAEEVWDPEYNTELIFGDDSQSGMGKIFTVGGESLHVQWGGIIGERGENYIGVEINLSGIEDEDGVIYPNGPGTFTISNMRILINGEQVW